MISFQSKCKFCDAVEVDAHNETPCDEHIDRCELNEPCKQPTLYAMPIALILADSLPNSDSWCFPRSSS